MKVMRYLAIGIAVLGTVTALSAWRFRAGTVTKLTVVEHADTDTVTDTGATGDTVGDILTFANKVFDEKNEKQIGSDQGQCFRTAVGVSWECNWTLILADGQLVVEGPFLDAGDSQLAIIGGTGSYASATGQMTLHARNEKGTEYDFTYEISAQ